MLSVFSEIGKLKRVLVHSPGAEVDDMPPSLMEQMLFDDLLYGPAARTEHAYLCKIMAMLDVKVFDMQTLFAEAASDAPKEFSKLVAHICSFERLEARVAQRLKNMPPQILAEAFVQGIKSESQALAADKIYDLLPTPNLLFMRDPQFIIGDSIAISTMKEHARKREPLISSFTFRHHRDFKGCHTLMDGSADSLRREAVQFGLGTIEGGDVLVLKEGIILVGLSARTSEYGAEILIDALRTESSPFHTLIMVPMPTSRAQMHLDTIFTRIAADDCLAYSPMIKPGSSETLSAIKVELGDPHDCGQRYPSLLDALNHSGVKLNLIHCGGPDDYIQQSREQWTDGANAFVVRPGVILIYDRNTETIKELERQGYFIVPPEDVTATPAGSLHYVCKPERKYAFLIPSNELSRARGGPRCMTMPLARAEV